MGLIWVDAHADNRIVETSSTPVRMVGVRLSMMAGQTLPNFRKEICGLHLPIKGEHIIASDFRIMDEPTAEALCNANILRLEASVFEDAAAWERAVKKLASEVDVIYLSVDADILKAKYIPAYEKAVPYGHDLDVVMRNIRIVMETGKIVAYSVFCIDFDHYDRGGNYTYLNGMQLVTAGLSNWEKIPL
ncbi:arginase family protein [Dysosmobacter acutus]|uniref:arginase family protein n=1 Tax=Dysosmobacter acutus TaxID=2841504 RepID=UPI0030B9FDD0